MNTSTVENLPKWTRTKGKKLGHVTEGARMTYRGYCPMTDEDVREAVIVLGIYTKGGRTRVRVVSSVYDDIEFFTNPENLS